MNPDLADVLMLAALLPMMLMLAALLLPFGLVAASAWRRSRAPVARPAPAARPTSAARPPAETLPPMFSRAA